ncbi:MAG: 6-phosphogluconolactonase [Salinivirgaceae bacterium]|jgi:6-phosphogluconolactonase
MNHKIYKSKEELAASLAEELYQFINGLKKDKITLAISGGITPFILFEQWAKNYAEKMPWNHIHFFWVDERCVEPINDESNFGNTKKTLFDKIAIPSQNIHRIMGENQPQQETERYAQEIDTIVEVTNGLPHFDILLLGMGDDGHTASIFPPSMQLLTAGKTVATTQNPYSHQNRITLTGPVINNAAQVYFLVTGKSKAPIVSTIFKNEQGFEKFPAAHIKPVDGKLIWVMDEEAAVGLQ